MTNFQVEDITLLEQVKNGSQEAFIKIYNRYWEKLYAAAYIRLKSKEAAEDIVQNIFINFWLKKEAANIHNLNAYLSAALKYEILDHLRDSKSHQSHQVNAYQEVSNNNNQTQDQLSFNELNAELAKGLALLPDKCKIVFELSRNEGLSTKEISSQLDISPKTVEFHISKAIRTLKLSLKDYIYILVFFLDLF